MACLRSNTSTLCIIFSIILFTLSECREDDAQVDATKSKKKFKLKKYNDIWVRALAKSISTEKLEQLEQTLRKLDKLELEAKHWDMEEQNEYSEMKPEVQEHLNEVLKEYDLFDHDMLEDEDVRFRDPRLNQLWRHAVGEGHYSTDELNSLHNEMRHMEKKMDEAHAFSEETEFNERKMIKNHPNMIEDTFDPADDANEMHKQAKEKKATIHKQFKHMQETILRKKKTDFNDERVSRLWDSAKNATFTEAELQTVKEELVHFQRYVDKLDHWEKINVNLQEKGSAQDSSHAQEKITEYKRKVKKYHKTMVTKINKKTEL